MKLLLVLATLSAAACAAVPERPDCSNSPALACQPGDTCRTSSDGQLHVCLPVPPRPEEMSPSAVRMMQVGHAIQLGSAPDDVERVTAALGRPTALTFQSCQRAGCVDTTEDGATSMVSSWHGEGRDHPVLRVEFCGRTGTWRAAHVSMNVTSGGGGAWGTFPRVRPVFAEMNEELRKPCLR